MIPIPRRLIALIILLLAIAYVIWPIDLIPDFIPIIGWIDDILVIVGAIIYFRKMF
jgi:uncharacterized membrane protein YkvA (DUF1232 family)